MAKYENQLEIFINFNEQVCKKIYSTTEHGDEDDDFGIKRFFNELSNKSDTTTKSLNLSFALSMILCENNSRKSAFPLKTSILIINENVLVPSSQYVHFMNSLFEAQRNGIKCNIIDIEQAQEQAQEGENVLLKQAASITSGFYMKIKSTSEIIQILLNFPPEISDSVQTILNRPKQDIVDFRGSCFCHGKVVDLGYVCSVCLSGKSQIYYSFIYLFLFILIIYNFQFFVVLVLFVRFVKLNSISHK